MKKKTHRNSFKYRLKKMRIERNLSQTKLGKIGGVVKTTQINYETGFRVPDVNYLIALSQEGFDVNYLLTGNVSKLKAPETKDAGGEDISNEVILERLFLKPILDSAESVQIGLDMLLEEKSTAFGCYSAAIAVQSSARILELKARAYYEATGELNNDEECDDE